MDARLGVAVAAGRLAGLLSRQFGTGGGTTIPGEVALRIEPRTLSKLAGRLNRGSVVVTGTNGKTTTSRLISSILQTAGWRPVHNRAGANLLNGLTSALVGDVDIIARQHGDVGLFEVDEAVVPEAVARVMPRVLLVTNLFRDQLDRYGELDYLASLWRKAIAVLPPSSTVVLNADDPLVASLGEASTARVVYFGVEDSRLGTAELEHAADSKVCLHCRQPYEYAVAYYGHVGVYRCPGCGTGRPAPDVWARRVDLQGDAGSRLDVATSGGDFSLDLHLPGVYNVYNALAAAATTLALGVSEAAIRNGVGSFVAAFGRLERVRIGDKTAFLALVKNPVGFNQVLRTVFAPPEASPEATPAAPDGWSKTALIVINDNFADGTDISWLWDVDFEVLAGRFASIVVSGTRAEDMLLRLKYADLDLGRITLVKELEAALAAGLERVASAGTLYVFPTYTAMLDLRAHLASRGYVEPFWEN